MGKEIVKNKETSSKKTVRCIICKTKERSIYSNKQVIYYFASVDNAEKFIKTINRFCHLEFIIEEGDVVDTSVLQNELSKDPVIFARYVHDWALSFSHEHSKNYKPKCNIMKK